MGVMRSSLIGSLVVHDLDAKANIIAVEEVPMDRVLGLAEELRPRGIAVSPDRTTLFVALSGTPSGGFISSFASARDGWEFADKAERRA